MLGSYDLPQKKSSLAATHDIEVHSWFYEAWQLHVVFIFHTVTSVLTFSGHADGLAFRIL
jgi:hypothetical protein